MGQFSSVMETLRAHLAVSPFNSCLMSVLKIIQPSPCFARDQARAVLRAPSPSLGKRPWLLHPTALTGPASDSGPDMRASPTHHPGAGGGARFPGGLCGQAIGKLLGSRVSTQGLVQLSVATHVAWEWNTAGLRNG